MKKIYILDTSVLAHDPGSFKTFDDGDVIIPVVVLDELDKLKKQMSDAGKNSRVAIKLLDELSELGDISTGIQLESGSLVKIDTTNYPNNFGDALYGDTRILACADNVYKANLSADTILVSNDINLRVRAKAVGLSAQSYERNKMVMSEIYEGISIVKHEEAASELVSMGDIDSTYYGFKFHLNECIVFQDENGNDICLGRQTAPHTIKLIKNKYPWDIAARNNEQAFAIDLIMDPKIPLVTLIGQAGTGKSLVTLASALELVLESREYEKFVIYRPIQPVGNDIGYLPGPQPLDAKIMTPNGWTTMGDIQPNDFIIGSDGLQKRVLKIFDKGEREVFKVVFNDGSYTECCEDHLWYTTTLQESQRKNGQGSVKSLKEIKSTLKTYKTQVNNHKIPMVKPVQFTEKETIVDPYIMGVLLGDGTLSENYSVYFTTSDEEIVKNCQDSLPYGMACKLKSKSLTSKACNYSFVNKKNIGRTHREDNIINREIVRLGLLGTKSVTKFIPDLYKFNSIKNRIALLQGMMDTDGFISEDGGDVVYYTISNALAEDFKFLVQSLGGKANISKKLVKYSFDNEIEKEIICNVVSLSLPQNICPVRISRKVNRFKPRKHELSRVICDIIPVGKKETKCILVESEDHLYATDQFILTHNTMEEKLAPWFQAIMDNFEILFTSSNGDKWKTNFDMYKKKERIQMEALTYIRGRSIPNAIILLDECQNITKDEIKTVLTRAGEGTKIILTGDVEQIDNDELDALNNGLTYVIEKFKDSPLAGHVTFKHGERSALATEAAKVL